MDDDACYRSVSKSFSMTAGMYAQVLEAARLRGVNRSRIVQHAIRQYLNLREDGEPYRARRRRRPCRPGYRSRDRRHG